MLVAFFFRFDKSSRWPGCSLRPTDDQHFLHRRLWPTPQSVNRMGESGCSVIRQRLVNELILGCVPFKMYF